MLGGSIGIGVPPFPLQRLTRVTEHVVPSEHWKRTCLRFVEAPARRRSSETVHVPHWRVRAPSKE